MLLPKNRRPASFFLKAEDNFEKVEKIMTQNDMRFPVILKPDVGFRGYMVKKIDNIQDLKAYLKLFNHPKILQEFVDYPNEMGVFYHRYPNKSSGEITSITLKKYLTIEGDGRSALEQLIRKDERAVLYFDLLKIIHEKNLDYVYPKGEKIILSFIGNHSKGTQFLNGNHLISSKLTEIIDQISRETEGWYYGRIDLKYDSFEKLLDGGEFKILEINGIISEPTHIYDASHKDCTYFSAIKSIKDHWERMDQIAKLNYAEHQSKIPSIKDYLKNLNWLRNYSNELKKLNRLKLNS